MLPAKSVTLSLPTPEAARAFGEDLGRRLRAGDVIALYGGLGEGKTTLTQGIAAGLGVSYDVDSPTYLLVQEHSGRVPLFHADLYRIESPQSLLEMGFEEYFERGGVTVIEWAERAEPLLPEDHLQIRLSREVETEEVRIVVLQGFGPRSARLVQETAQVSHE